MRALLNTLSIALLMTATPVLATAHVHKVTNPIPGQYIVVYRSGAVRPLGSSVLRGPSVHELASGMALAHNAIVRRNFEHAIKGSVMDMTAAQAEALANDPRVAYVGQDERIEVAGSEANPPSWGLDRIDQRALPLNDSYSYDSDGSGVDVYVADSGIRSTHVDFGGRVDTANSFTAINDGYGTEDCLGHGTMVAGVIGGTLMGAAKAVTLHSVRIADCWGGSSTSLLISGVDWITQQIEANTVTTTSGHGKHATTTTVKPRAIVNISISGPPAVPLDQAIESSIQAGAVYVVAAGNDSADACTDSVTADPNAIVVGASNKYDQVAGFSNQGPCVDLFAPGTNIVTDLATDDTAVAPYFSGTSASSPAVAGAAAAYWSQHPNATAAEVEAAIIDGATTGVLTGLTSGSPNRLLFSGSATSSLDAPPSAAFAYTCKKNGSCTFDASGSSDDNGIVRYDWDFGDGWAGVGIAPSHSYATRKGTAIVTLTVTDAAGQMNSVSQSVSY